MSQRTALVTGANGGIGRAICQRLREAGHRVLTLDIAGECDFQVDLAHGALPDGAFDDVDICVANAGIVDTIAPAHTMSAEKWARDIDLNLTGTFRIVQACLRGMRERRWVASSPFPASAATARPARSPMRRRRPACMA